MGQRCVSCSNGVPAHRLPSTGGTSATVVVLLDYDKLRTGLGAAHLDTGQAISAPGPPAGLHEGTEPTPEGKRSTSAARGRPSTADTSDAARAPQ